MCMDCERKFSRMRVAAARAEIDAREDAKYEFVAVYGKTTITRDTFQEIGGKLLEEGFLMAQATSIAPLTLRVPHKSKKREAAAIRKVEKA